MCTFFKKQHNPAFMSHSPNFSLIFSHNLRCWGYLNILWGFHKHREVVGEKNGCRSKILSPEVCSYMTLVNYLATFTVNFLKCSGKTNSSYGGCENKYSLPSHIRNRMDGQVFCFLVSVFMEVLRE